MCQHLQLDKKPDFVQYALDEYLTLARNSVDRFFSSAPYMANIRDIVDALNVSISFFFIIEMTVIFKRNLKTCQLEQRHS